MNLIDRPFYTEKLLAYTQKNEIKILTGVRGVGKSSILNLFRQMLLTRGIDENNIIRIDLESIEFCFTTNSTALYEFINNKINKSQKFYLLIDEVQRIQDWQMVITALKADFNIDIYISSSGSNLITQEFCQQLNHKPLEIHILPLSFKEYRNFYQTNDSMNIDELFSNYLRLGSMPVDFEHLRNTFFSTMAQDIFANNKIADNSMMILLTKLLFTEMGKVHSFNSISKLLSEIIEKPPAVRTIENYVKMLVDSNLFYCVPVFDIKNNYSLTRYAKYYPVDLGFYSLIMGEHDLSDIHILESVVYFELLRLGVKVSTCKVGNKKVAFLAESNDNKIYVQVLNSLTDNAKDIFIPLRSINDHYSKWILTIDKVYSHSEDGIRISNIIDFLLEE